MAATFDFTLLLTQVFGAAHFFLQLGCSSIDITSFVTAYS